MTTLFADPAPTRSRALVADRPPFDRQAAITACVPLCRGLARHLCPPDHSEARREQRIEDITGEALLAVVEMARTFDPAGPAEFSTVAYSYASKRVRRIIDEQRMAAGHATGIDLAQFAKPDAGEAFDGVTGEEVADQDGYDHDDDERELLGRLPGRMRQCVALVLAGFTPDQAAVQLGMEPKDVKLSIRNAAKILEEEKAKLARPNLFSEVGEQ